MTYSCFYWERLKRWVCSKINGGSDCVPKHVGVVPPWHWESVAENHGRGWWSSKMEPRGGAGGFRGPPALPSWTPPTPHRAFWDCAAEPPRSHPLPQPCSFASPHSHWFGIWCPVAVLAHPSGHRFTGVSLKHFSHSTFKKKKLKKKKGGGGSLAHSYRNSLKALTSSSPLPLPPPWKKCVQRQLHRRKCLQSSSGVVLLG